MFNPLEEKMLWLQPDRITEFSGWRGHLPFALWLMPALRPRRFVELGTHTGDSYCAFCQSVQTEGLEREIACFAVDTWEGDDHAGFYQETVWEDIQKYHRDRGYENFSRLLRMTFEESAREFEDGSVDLLHIDGFHTYEAVRHDYETFLPKLSKSAVVLFHDTAVRDRGFEVYRFWDEVRAGKPHFTFNHSNGLGVLAVGDTPPVALSLFFDADAEKTSLLQTLFTHLGERWRLEGDLTQARNHIAASEEGIEWLREQVKHREAGQEQLREAYATLEAETRRVWQEREALSQERDALRADSVRLQQIESHVLFRMAKKLQASTLR